MRIGIDCRLWNETGVGRYIRNLVIELQELDKENHYILFFQKDEFETVPLAKNFQKRLADIAWHSLDEQFSFKTIIEKEELDLMHFPYFAYPIGYRRKFIITIHDLIIDHFPTGKASTLPSPIYFLKRLGYKYILHQAIQNSKKIITVSGATKQEIIDHYQPIPEKIIVTYEGTDKNISPSSAEKIDIKLPFFFSVGNAYPHKNLERFVEAFELFSKENSQCYFIFVGKKDYFSTRLEEVVIQKRLMHKMFFYHEVTDGQLAYLFAHAIALVTPSLMEGFGLPAIEAMSNNCLALLSEIPAFLEVSGDAAVYFDPYDKEDIAKTLSLAYKKKIPDVAEKKYQGLIRAKGFSWKKMAKQTLEIYEQTA